MNSVDEGLLPAVRHSRERGTFRIVYHGSLTPAYGVGVLIQAAAHLEGEVLAWRLDIYGDGDCLPSLLEQADRLAVSRRVSFSRGYLPHREVLQHVAGASVAVIPNLDIKLNQFALPTKLFEYVALRVPVVAAALPTICEYFGANELFLFKPGDERELAETLFVVARDPRQAAERAERAFVRYQQYRWPVNAARYRAVVNHQCREEHSPVITAPDRQSHR
jgi:glycosyltransferase involved in cell wall biosynthesis